MNTRRAGEDMRKAGQALQYAVGARNEVFDGFNIYGANTPWLGKVFIGAVFGAAMTVRAAAQLAIGTPDPLPQRSHPNDIG
jgi:hypothetical protein